MRQAGLFSAVVTALVAITLNLIASVSDNQIPRASREDTVVNALFVASLSCSVIAAFGAMAGKQVISHAFVPRGTGSFKQNALAHQRALDVERRWHFKGILEALPILLQLSILLFFAGITLYLWNRSREIAIVTLIFGCAGTLGYVILFQFVTASFNPTGPWLIKGMRFVVHGTFVVLGMPEPQSEDLGLLRISVIILLLFIIPPFMVALVSPLVVIAIGMGAILSAVVLAAIAILVAGVAVAVAAVLGLGPFILVAFLLYRGVFRLCMSCFGRIRHGPEETATHPEEEDETKENPKENFVYQEQGREGREGREAGETQPEEEQAEQKVFTLKDRLLGRARDTRQDFRDACRDEFRCVQWALTEAPGEDIVFEAARLIPYLSELDHVQELFCVPPALDDFLIHFLSIITSSSSCSDPDASILYSTAVCHILLSLPPIRLNRPTLVSAFRALHASSGLSNRLSLFHDILAIGYCLDKTDAPHPAHNAPRRISPKPDLFEDGIESFRSNLPFVYLSISLNYEIDEDIEFVAKCAQSLPLRQAVSLRIWFLSDGHKERIRNLNSEALKSRWSAYTS